MISAKRLTRIQFFLTLLSTFCVIAGVSVCYHIDLYKRVDNFLYDLHIKWRGTGRTSGNIVLVLMDDKSATELGRSKCSWSSRHVATALSNLCVAGAEVIGLDMLLSAPDPDPEADVLLAGAINDCSNIILPRIVSTLDGREVLPLPVFREAMIGDGFIDFPLDEDGILRRVRFLNTKPLAEGGVELFPSFSLELARVFLNIDYTFDFSQKDFFVMGDKKSRNIRLPFPELMINFKGDYKAFTCLSFADVVMNRFSQQSVKGKLVIMGSSLAVQKDFFSTPFSRFQTPGAAFKDRSGTIVEGVLGNKDPGVACHAFAVETILSRNFFLRMPGFNMALIAIAGLIGLMFYLPRVNMLWVVLLLVSCLVGVTGSAHFVFIQQLMWLDITPVICILLVQFVVGVILQKIFFRKKMLQVTSVFGKYVSPAVVDELITQDIAATLEGRHQELTILFCDLRNFTPLSENLGAKDTSRVLNIFFDAMIPVIQSHKGTLDKLMGDAVMTFFGAPLPFPDHPVKACEAALGMIEALKTLKQDKSKDFEQMEIGIGLNTGVVTIGNLGSHEFKDYTIIGDPVNLASRLEGLNKIYDTQVILSEFTAASLDSRFLTRKLDIVRVKGKKEPVTIYELLDYKDRSDDRTRELVKIFEEGLTAYRNRQWETACEAFKKALETDSQDTPSRLFLEKANRLKNNPPGEEWDGVTTL